ncbi:MAG: T9SS type A sorting domain-containing protein [Flavobacteriales bacterium]|nr:T9SS type A sorting domain-containing protein [Flavobacteriales bacterium]
MVRGPLCLAAVTIAAALPAQDLVRGEYFIDADPGFGNGTSLTFTPAPEVALQLSIDMVGLSPGPHVLGIRMKDGAGHWGLTNRRFFMLRSMATGGDIVRFEYFLDTDPGFGNGTQLPAGPAPEVVNVLAEVLTDGLPAGPHTLFVRSLSSTGAWSITNATIFNVLVGMAELEHWGMTAGPNPIRDVLVLRRSIATSVIELDLLDAQGRRLRSHQWIGDRIEIGTEDLAAGGYFLLLWVEGAAPVVVKLLKQ